MKMYKKFKDTICLYIYMYIYMGGLMGYIYTVLLGHPVQNICFASIKNLDTNPSYNNF